MATFYWDIFRRNANNADRVAKYRKAEREGRAIPRSELRKLKGDTPIYTFDSDGQPSLNPANLDKEGAFDFKKFRQNNADRAEQRRTGIKGAKAPRPTVVVNGKSFDNVADAIVFARQTVANNKAREKVMRSRREAIAAVEALGIESDVFKDFDPGNGEVLTEQQKDVLGQAYAKELRTLKRRLRENSGGIDLGENPYSYAAELQRRNKEEMRARSGGGPVTSSSGSVNGVPTVPGGTAAWQRDLEHARLQAIRYEASGKGQANKERQELENQFALLDAARIAYAKKRLATIMKSASLTGVNLFPYMNAEQEESANKADPIESGSTSTGS